VASLAFMPISSRKGSRGLTEEGNRTTQRAGPLLDNPSRTARPGRPRDGEIAHTMIRNPGIVFASRSSTVERKIGWD